MKISLKWLSQFVDVAPFWKDPESLGELLTRAGLEVEEINDQRGQMKNVLVGIILKKEAHPQADRLSLCQVSTGEHVVHQIVCGAQNHKANDKVFIALPGAVLPGDFKIQKAVVRGVESGGMLCSAKELGLAADSDGLLILPPETKVGLSFADWSGQDDVLLELKVTPNRADCLSHWGLAREVGGLLGKELCPPEKRIPATQKSPQFSIEVQVQAPDECLRYSGRSLVGVRVGPSPEPVRRRLEALGIKPINNVVDATNYVMLELGQPLHAFDASEIRGGLLRVRKAEAGEPLKTLDGTDLKMKGGELVITDREGLLAMAGVIGGLGTGVKETTTEVFLESAYFKPSSVRKSSRLHGVTTDSAYRFTRGVDPDSTLRALDRAAELIREWAHAEPAGEVRDFYPSPVTRAAIAITADQVSESMGYSAEPSEIELWLGRMGCRLEKQGERAWKVTPPVHRFDLEIPMDLVEEFARQGL